MAFFKYREDDIILPSGCRVPDKINCEYICANIADKYNEKCFRIDGGILSGPTWNDGLRLASNFRHAPGVILIESIVVVINNLRSAIFPSSIIYTDLKWERRSSPHLYHQLQDY